LVVHSQAQQHTTDTAFFDVLIRYRFKFSSYIAWHPEAGCRIGWDGMGFDSLSAERRE
jgi:hypothetical protein